MLNQFTTWFNSVVVAFFTAICAWNIWQIVRMRKGGG